MSSLRKSLWVLCPFSYLIMMMILLFCCKFLISSYQIHGLEIFLPFCRLPLYCVVYFAVQKLFSLMQFHVYSHFCCHIQGIIAETKIHIPPPLCFLLEVLHFQILYLSLQYNWVDFSVWYKVREQFLSFCVNIHFPQ